MGHITNNLLTKGFSGKIGEDVVFRQLKNRTIFAKRPCKRTTVTPNQAVKQTLFQQAVRYARSVLWDDARRADYDAVAKKFKMRCAYLAAIADYMRMPDVAYLNVIAYTGKEGQPIEVLAHDPFKIIEATFVIKQADGVVLEMGPAVPLKNGWVYTTQTANATLTGCVIQVTLKDRLNKTGVKEVVL